jgi:hypothetical protein
MTVEEGEEIVRTARATGGSAPSTTATAPTRWSATCGDGRARRPRRKSAWSSPISAMATMRMRMMQDNPRVRWRYDPAQAGVSAQMADCGIHAHASGSFVTGDEVEKLSADFASCVSGRELEDDAMVNFRTEGGTVGRLWTSTIAIGRQHGLDIQVYGEKGGLRWAQEQPNQVYWQRAGGPHRDHGEGRRWHLRMAARAQPMCVDLCRHRRGCAAGGARGRTSTGCARWRRCMRRYPQRAQNARADALIQSAAFCGTVESFLRIGLRSDGGASTPASAKGSAKQNGAWVDARPPMLSISRKSLPLCRPAWSRRDRPLPTFVPRMPQRPPLHDLHGKSRLRDNGPVLRAWRPQAQSTRTRSARSAGGWWSGRCSPSPPSPCR